MAVPKKKTSKARRDKRRAQHKIDPRIAKTAADSGRTTADLVATAATFDATRELGPWLAEHDIKIIFALPGIVLATTVHTDCPYCASHRVSRFTSHTHTSFS